MHYRVSFFIFLFSLLTIVQAGSIVVIQGDHTAFGQKYFAGFSSLVKHKVSAYKYSPDSELSLMGKIHSIRPDVIMTIGAVPLQKLIEKFSTTPIIAADYYDNKLKSKANLIMLDQSQPIGHAFDIVEMIFKRSITWGVIYDPKYSQADYDAITLLAKQKGIKVLAVKADKIIDIKSALPAFKGKIQAFLQLKDITLNHPDANEAIGSFCQSNGIAWVSLNPYNSTQYTPLFSASIDPIVLGEKAYRLADSIISTNRIIQYAQSKQSHAEIISTLSMGTLSKLGISDNAILSLLNSITNQDIRVLLVK
ncbi:MAG TPA: hypothetical protein PKC21_08965 [Oligoflexia bacterium]|nr:hypothetical protein [Oligoflexia bacterium]HMR25470.1 hypothetical protein [Oligoflexia bacterium]